MELRIVKMIALVALWMGVASGLRAQTVVEYIHTDALGTPVAVTNAAGTVIERSVYEPYGQLINRPLTDGPGFTGHVQDAATGLTYMQQRYYDPMCGCFLSVDPVTAYDNGDMRYFNRYAYAFNNPYKFTDPDGRETKLMPGNGVTQLDMIRFIVRLAFSPTAKQEMFQIEQSQYMYELHLGNDVTPWYDQSSRTVWMRSTPSLFIGSEGAFQDPLINGIHEISHAAEHDRIGLDAFNKNLEWRKNSDGVDIVPIEEQRATRIERQVGKELNLPTRKVYQDTARPPRPPPPPPGKK